MLSLLPLLTTALIIGSAALFGQTSAPETALVSAVASAFRQAIDVGPFSIQAPTVIEIPLNTTVLERNNVAVLDISQNAFEPSYLKEETTEKEAPRIIAATTPTAPTASLFDGDEQTFADFYLPNTGIGTAQINLQTSQPITSSRLVALLSNHVALPIGVEIRAIINGANQIIVANRPMDQQMILFPITTAREWIITFTYTQPLRIAELRLMPEYTSTSHSQALRFLAQPHHAYRIFLDSDRTTFIPILESGNLASNEGVLRVSATPTLPNPLYVIADSDSDSVPDVQDNCVTHANPDQADVNKNRRGDACDDFDRDDIMNAFDNCINHPNQSQQDTDGDGSGDSCDQEESRLTERHPWVPWLGIGFAALVLIVLFALTGHSMVNRPPSNTPIQPSL